jgi:glycosyltransferase involved in cell wall biosynthesis
VPKPRQPGLSIVIPVFNEEANLAPLVEQVSQAVTPLGLPWELILVDDGSRDGTPEAIRQLCSDNVRGLRLSRNSGQSTALLAGLRVARYNTLASMDGDLQNDPADLPRLMSMLEGADLVCGIRQKRQDSSWIRLVSRVANRIRSHFTGDGVTDTGCSLKVMTAQVAENILWFRGAHRFLPALAQLAGYRVAEVAVSHRPRHSGKTNYGNWMRLKATVPDLIGFMWLKSRYAEYAAEEI